ncbi:hypothetical protein Metfor_1578 [Methanoregula formicica SMSP]|uniref:Carboxypeptidase regulatory-like domain-containing protein n=2 Tax=Methanoregula formicica TaxID=882104 RepID=L0HH15_METFS|nr:hypothetical protein Metfor_1578 [Methanoregula formicica SMSP]
MTEHLIHLTVPHNFLFIFRIMKFALPVLIGILMIIPAIHAEPDMNTSTIPSGDSVIILDIKAPQEKKVFLNLPEPPRVTVIGYVRNMESLQSVIVSSNEGSTDCGNTSFISCTIPVTKGLNQITITAMDSVGRRVSTTRNFSIEYGVPDLPPRITISGKITTPDGRPVAGATVRTEFPRPYDTKTVTVQSDADGTYRINNAHGFRQKISVEKNGYTNITKEMTFTQNVNTADFILEPTTKSASGLTIVMCFVAIFGVILIFSRKQQTHLV